MLFNTTEFFVFLAIVLAVFYASPRAFRRVILLIASYVFYLSWNYKFVVLLLGLTVVDYVAAIAIERAPATRKKPFLLISLAANLGMLGFFKYYNFFADLQRFPWPAAAELGKISFPEKRVFAGGNLPLQNLSPLDLPKKFRPCPPSSPGDKLSSTFHA